MIDSPAQPVSFSLMKIAQYIGSMSYKEFHLELFNSLIEIPSIKGEYNHPIDSTVDYKTLLFNFPELNVDFEKIKVGDIVGIEN